MTFCRWKMLIASLVNKTLPIGSLTHLSIQPMELRAMNSQKQSSAACYQCKWKANTLHPEKTRGTCEFSHKHCSYAAYNQRQTRANGSRAISLSSQSIIWAPNLWNCSVPRDLERIFRSAESAALIDAQSAGSDN